MKLAHIGSHEIRMMEMWQLLRLGCLARMTVPAMVLTSSGGALHVSTKTNVGKRQTINDKR